METIKIELENYLQHADDSIKQILFTDTEKHPVWEDNLAILQLANKQILQPLGNFPDEQILAFIGLHAKTAITGKRDSIGFLITNYRILTQTAFSVIGKPDNAQSFLFTSTQINEEVSNKVWNDFQIKNTIVTTHEDLAVLQTTIKQVVNIILPELQKLPHLPKEIVKSSDINTRIKELGLQTSLKKYENKEKNIKKFADKFNVTNIQFGIVDKPFFGGPYGIVFTKDGISSRDLMEDCISTTWEAIKKNPATLGEKEDIILAGLERHVVPKFEAKFVPAIITLINEITSGEVKI